MYNSYFNKPTKEQKPPANETVSYAALLARTAFGWLKKPTFLSDSAVWDNRAVACVLGVSFVTVAFDNWQSRFGEADSVAPPVS